MIRSLTVAGLAIICCGCAALYLYQEPYDGPRARVRFVAAPGADVYRYDDDQCKSGEDHVVRMNSSPKRLGLPLWKHDENAAKEFYVRARRPFHGMFAYGVSTAGGAANLRTTCNLGFSFMPLEGRDYEVLYTYDGQGCRVQLFDLQPQANGEVVRRPGSLLPKSENACTKPIRSPERR